MRDSKLAYTVDEASERTGIGRNTLRKLIEWKKLPVLKVGRRLLIRADAYSVQRTEEEVAALLLKDLEENEDVVLASVRGNYSEQIEKLFDLAVYIDIPKEIRMARVRKRSNDKFGNRMLPGGDLYESEERFFKMVEERSDDHAKRWLTELSCPVISINGTVEVANNVEILTNVIS